MGIGSPIPKLKISVHRAAIANPRIAAFQSGTLPLLRQASSVVSQTVAKRPSDLTSSAKHNRAPGYVGERFAYLVPEPA